MDVLPALILFICVLIYLAVRSVAVFAITGFVLLALFLLVKIFLSDRPHHSRSAERKIAYGIILLIIGSIICCLTEHGYKELITGQYVIGGPHPSSDWFLAFGILITIYGIYGVFTRNKN